MLKFLLQCFVSGPTFIPLKVLPELRANARRVGPRPSKSGAWIGSGRVKYIIIDIDVAHRSILCTLGANTLISQCETADAYGLFIDTRSGYSRRILDHAHIMHVPRQFIQVYDALTTGWYEKYQPDSKVFSHDLTVMVSAAPNDVICFSHAAMVGGYEP